jgi:hypothetical protein
MRSVQLAITLSLVALAILPWLGLLFRSVELRGGFKVEFQDRLDRARERADKAGLLAEPGAEGQQYTFQLVADQDPNRALAGLRIELERQLKALAEAVGVGTRVQGARRLVCGSRGRCREPRFALGDGGGTAAPCFFAGQGNQTVSCATA